MSRPNATDSSRQARQVLAATSISYTIVLLDASIINVGLEQIGDSFNSGVSGLQWIVNAYTLTFASFLLTGGTLGDRLGARNIYLAGLAVFTLASALCGFAPDLATLACARALQGVGSAMLVPCSLSLINQAYPDPGKRAAAIGMWMGCGGIAMASGPLLGGLLIHWFGWRSIFFVNLPLGLLGIGLTWRLPRSQALRSRHFDAAGQLTAIIALGSLIAVLIEAPLLGWRSTPIVAGILTCAAFGLLFVRIETRQQQPMLPLAFFRNRLFSASALVSMASALVFYGMLFSFSLYYQRELGYAPLQAGLAFLPMTVTVAVGGLWSGRLAGWFGARASMCTAFCLYAGGAAGMLLAGPGSPYWLAVLPMLAIGLASGFISPAATAPAMGTVEKSRAGIAAAVLNSARQTGAALGVAIFGAMLTALQPFQHGLHLVLGIASIVALAAALLWWFCAGPPVRMAEVQTPAKKRALR
ncbi:MFS transporter [Collimonas pratensis]|uniref:Sugar (And other) transporter family protein n=1 Tax=Collimonas pratensis TaxID=279113 RepID=A0ABM5Z158_9BURK|nr:MFS transporter [Collimonas pratensis]AMP12597.1 sugar (and other) transporter family protein [Collimonas pratensis]